MYFYIHCTIIFINIWIVAFYKAPGDIMLSSFVINLHNDILPIYFHFVLNFESIKVEKGTKVDWTYKERKIVILQEFCAQLDLWHNNNFLNVFCLFFNSGQSIVHMLQFFSTIFITKNCISHKHEFRLIPGLLIIIMRKAVYIVIKMRYLSCKVVC